MTQLEDSFERYKRERTLYEALVRECESRARMLCRRRGVRCIVQGRAKTLESFAKKLILRPQSYEEVYDKAGIRILPTYPDERDKVAKILESEFEITWIKDFVDEMEPNRFDYRGLHITAKLKEEHLVGEVLKLRDLTTEIQVHRPGESIWANVSHDLLYKSRLGSDLKARRAMNRLSALLEMVDISMEEIRLHLLSGPSAHLARILDALELDFDIRNFKALHQGTRLPSSHWFTVRDPPGLEAPRIIAAVAALDDELPQRHHWQNVVHEIGGTLSHTPTHGVARRSGNEQSSCQAAAEMALRERALASTRSPCSTHTDDRVRCIRFGLGQKCGNQSNLDRNHSKRNPL